jgi:hypothetical protein
LRLLLSRLVNLPNSLLLVDKHDGGKDDEMQRLGTAAVHLVTMATSFMEKNRTWKITVGAAASFTKQFNALNTISPKPLIRHCP